MSAFRDLDRLDLRGHRNSGSATPDIELVEMTRRISKGTVND